MRPYRFHTLLVLNVVFFFLWLLLWSVPWPPGNDPEAISVKRCHHDLACGCNLAEKLAPNLSYLAERHKRPLLVRFDWYSRSQTPVHLG